MLKEICTISYKPNKKRFDKNRINATKHKIKHKVKHPLKSSLIALLESKYYSCKYGAQRRKLRFELSFNEYKDIVSKSCYYCGTPNKIGIDRADNNIGYIKSNCVPCCWVCNKMKNNMQQHSFIEHTKRIAFRFLEQTD